MIFEFAILRFFQSDLIKPKNKELKDKQVRSIDRDQQEKRQRDAARMQIDDQDESGESPADFFPKKEEEEEFIPPTRKFSFTNKKCVYIAPIKALCEQRYSDWAAFQLHLGLKVLQVTGDREASFSQLAQAQIIITTPEKWSE